MYFHIFLYGDSHQQTCPLVLSNSSKVFFLLHWPAQLQNFAFHFSLITHSWINLAKQIGLRMMYRGVTQSTSGEVEKWPNISIYCFLSLSQLLIDWYSLTTYTSKAAFCQENINFHYNHVVHFLFTVLLLQLKESWKSTQTSPSCHVIPAINLIFFIYLGNEN